LTADFCHPHPQVERQQAGRGQKLKGAWANNGPLAHQGVAWCHGGIQWSLPRASVFLLVQKSLKAARQFPQS